MKVNVFLPKYMMEFKCICSSCTDTCCAGWDINIDKDTFNKYNNSIGDTKKLVEGKFVKNEDKQDSFNYGFMILKEHNRCPFLNSNMLCDIHGQIGEDKLCITCKNYPRVFNIIDNVYEKSGLPSCIEICNRAFLNKEKMEFIEGEEDIEEKNIEIRRIIDTEAFEGTESLLEYFWDIRIISINIMQNRSFSIEERLNILKNFYIEIENLSRAEDFLKLEEYLEDFSDEAVDYENLKGREFKEKYEFYIDLINDKLVKNIRSVKLKECAQEYKSGILSVDDICNYLENTNKYFNELEECFYVFENYLVNQIFKNVIPFNKGGNLSEGIKVLINSYRIIKAYVIGIAINSKEKISDRHIVRVIQALSKDVEHNKVFKELLEDDYC